MIKYIITYCVTMQTVMGTFTDCENYKSFYDVKKAFFYSDSIMRKKGITNVKTYSVTLVNEVKDFKLKDK
jgi:hypothetical protein